MWSPEQTSSETSESTQTGPRIGGEGQSSSMHVPSSGAPFVFQGVLPPSLQGPAPVFSFPAGATPSTTSSDHVGSGTGTGTGQGFAKTGKRNSRDDDGGMSDIDALVGQITNKMATLTAQQEWSTTDLLNVFIEVLDVETAQAQFFLEMAQWNIEIAVSYYMDWQTENQMHRQSQLLTQQHRSKKKTSFEFVGRDVEIVGLPPNWIARVSRHSGEIYFINQLNGKTQNAVPPGYADAPKPAENGEGAAADGGNDTSNNGSGAMDAEAADGGSGGGGDGDGL